MIVTEIRYNGKKKKVYIYADNEYLMSMETEAFKLSGIKQGSNIDIDEINKILKEVNLSRAKEKALRLLTFRSHSRKELTEKIGRKYDIDSAKEAVKKMEQIGLVNDEDFAKSYASEMFNRKRFSIRRVEHELLLKGIDKEIIWKIIDEFDPDEDKNIEELLERKYKNKFSDDKGYRRTVASLQRLGYTWEQIRPHISGFLHGDEN